MILNSIYRHEWHIYNLSSRFKKSNMEGGETDRVGKNW